MEKLVELLGISESTVRRDLDELEIERKLNRIHGGAERLKPSKEELSNKQKSIKNIHEKKIIAKKAYEFIEEGDVIFIDAGTTNEMLINIIERKDITVVTNSIEHAQKLLNKEINTIIIGGNIKLITNANIGSIAIEQIKKLHFDKAFVGINGFTNKYFTTPDIEEAEVKKAIIENSRSPFILADHTKVGKISFVTVCTIDKAVIVTNKNNNKLMCSIKKRTKVIEV